MSAVLDARSADYAAELIERARAKGADAAQALVHATSYFEIDFNNRGVELLRTTEDETTAITVFRDGKRARTLNGREAEAVEAALSAALTAAEAGIADEANDVANAASLPPSDHGPAEADSEGMLAAVEAFIEGVNTRYPTVRTRNNIYSFSSIDTVFVNSRGVRQRETARPLQFRRDVHGEARPQNDVAELFRRVHFRPLCRPLRGRQRRAVARGDDAFARTRACA